MPFQHFTELWHFLLPYVSLKVEQRRKAKLNKVFFSFFSPHFFCPLLRSKEGTPPAPAQVTRAVHLNHILNYITRLCSIINSSFLEALRKYGSQLEIQVEGVTKYTLPSHTGTQSTNTLSDGDGGKQGAEYRKGGGEGGGSGEQAVNQRLV